MNRQAIEQLRDQYLNDRSVIFAMPAIVQEVPCGTAMCYAGQVCANEGWLLNKQSPDALGALAKKDGNIRDAIDVAREALEIWQDEATRLFIKGDWPDDLKNQPDTPALAAERLQRFLDSDGRE